MRVLKKCLKVNVMQKFNLYIYFKEQFAFKILRCFVVLSNLIIWNYFLNHIYGMIRGFEREYIYDTLPIFQIMCHKHITI